MGSNDLHKPGFGAILKLLIAHSASVDWLIEYTTDGVTWELKQALSFQDRSTTSFTGSKSRQETGKNPDGPPISLLSYRRVCGTDPMKRGRITGSSGAFIPAPGGMGRLFCRKRIPVLTMLCRFVKHMLHHSG